MVAGLGMERTRPDPEAVHRVTLWCSVLLGGLR